MKGRGTIKNLGPGKTTVATMGDKPRDWFVPGWDSKPGALQHSDRMMERIEMGQKMTPPGRATLIPSRRK